MYRMTSSNVFKIDQNDFNNSRKRDQPELLGPINLASALHSGTAAPLDIIDIGVLRLLVQYCPCESLDGAQHGCESASDGAAAHSTEPCTQTRVDKDFKLDVPRALSHVLAVEGASRMDACYEDGTVASPCHVRSELGRHSSTHASGHQLAPN